MSQERICHRYIATFFEILKVRSTSLINVPTVTKPKGVEPASLMQCYTVALPRLHTKSKFVQGEAYVRCPNGVLAHGFASCFFSLLATDFAAGHVLWTARTWWHWLSVFLMCIAHCQFELCQKVRVFSSLQIRGARRWRDHVRRMFARAPLRVRSCTSRGLTLRYLSKSPITSSSRWQRSPYLSVSLPS